MNWSTGAWCYNQQGPYGNWDERWFTMLYGADNNPNPGSTTFYYALYVDAGGTRYWDNNNGWNYSVQVGGGCDHVDSFNDSCGQGSQWCN